MHRRIDEACHYETLNGQATINPARGRLKKDFGRSLFAGATCIIEKKLAGFGDNIYFWRI
jgi:hypothetical protein